MQTQDKSLHKELRPGASKPWNLSTKLTFSFLETLNLKHFTSTLFYGCILGQGVQLFMLILGHVRLFVPHGLQPTRLLCPQNFPGKNTGVVCHFLLQCTKVKSENEVAQSCPTLHDPWFEQTPGDSEGQGSLACCSPWGLKKLNNNTCCAFGYILEQHASFCFCLNQVRFSLSQTVNWLLDLITLQKLYL